MANQQYFLPMQQQPLYYDINHTQYQQQISGPGQQSQPMVPYFTQPQNMMPAADPNLYQNYPSQQNFPGTSQQFTDHDWQIVTSKKRLRSPEEETKTRKQTKLSDYWLKRPVETKNRFNELMDDDETETEKGEKEESVSALPKPPPITVYKVGYIEHIQKALTEIAPKQYIIKTIGPETIKIQLEKPEHYSNVIKLLDEKNTQYHTYRSKEDKGFKVVLRGIHPSTEPDIIIQALKEKDHEVLNLHTIRHRTSKIELPLWYVEIKNKDNNKDIYNITNLEQTVIKFEPPHAKRIIPQCARCQEYGHTKNYCRKTARCVKCAGIHATKDCERKVQDNNVKCVNCTGSHPANYRGCVVHKQLQQRLYPTLREKKVPQARAPVIPTQQINSVLGAQTGASNTGNALTESTTRGPHFDAGASKNVTALLGKTAYLNCRVKNLANRTMSPQVSWVRHRDVHLLTVGRYTYTSDQRFRAIHQPHSEDWTLQIKYPQHRDSGVYECQVSSTPHLSHFIHLTVIEPDTEIVGGPELFIDRGSTINLTCVVRHSPEPPAFIFWNHNDGIISYTSSRGGVSVSTERGETSRSVLLIQKAKPSDSGNYQCNPSNARPANVTVHVLNGEHPEAMQHGGNQRMGPSLGALAFISYILLAYC